MNKLALILVRYILPFIAISVLATSSYGDIDHSQHMAAIKNKNKGFSISEENFALLDVELIASNGEKTTLLKELDTNTPIILNFIFTTCNTICPIMTGTFSTINRILKNKTVKMMTISIDPEYDTPKALSAYSKKFNANKKWHFYTGESKNIVSIQKSFTDYRGSKMNHTPNTFIRYSNKSKWLKITGFISSAELIKIYNENKIM